MTVQFPWGSLLRGVLGLDEPVMRGIAALLGPEGHLTSLVSIVPADGVPGYETLD